MSLGRFVEKHLERALRDQSAGGRSRRCKMEEALQLGGGVVRRKRSDVRWGKRASAGRLACKLHKM